MRNARPSASTPVSPEVEAEPEEAEAEAERGARANSKVAMRARSAGETVDELRLSSRARACGDGGEERMTQEAGETTVRGGMSAFGSSSMMRTGGGAEEMALTAGVETRPVQTLWFTRRAW